MTRYPLLFGFRDLVAGKGFVAGIAIDGRALLVDEDDGFWMYGVNPGGVAGGGPSIGDAQVEFRSSYRSVLFDIAGEAESFDQFEEEVTRFFRETNEPTLAEWEDAVKAVRTGEVDADWLPKGNAESKIGLKVQLVEHPEPSVNALDEAKLAA